MKRYAINNMLVRHTFYYFCCKRPMLSTPLKFIVDIFCLVYIIKNLIVCIFIQKQVQMSVTGLISAGSFYLLTLLYIGAECIFFISELISVYASNCFLWYFNGFSLKFISSSTNISLFLNHLFLTAND